MCNPTILTAHPQNNLSAFLNKVPLSEERVAAFKQQVGRLKRKKNKVLPGACLLVFFMLHMQSLKNESEALGNLRRSLSTVEDSDTTGSFFSKPELFLAEEHIVEKDHSIAVPAPTSIPIFYNLFIKEDSDIPRVSNFMREQLETYMKPVHGPVMINSIGVIDNLAKLNLPPSIDAKLMNNFEEADEVDTLQELWTYCSRDDTHPEQKVAYLHSKGSFHQHDANDKLRVYLTKGALSEECSNMPDTCNVCSSRMSPMPHPHTSGNMWLSRCDYVRKLIAPKQFRNAMYTTNKALHRTENACMGTGRYALEHW